RTLKAFIACSDTVPSNTEDKWYKELIVVGTKECSVSFRQSPKGEWVRVTLTFNSPILRSESIFSNVFIKAINLKTD
ncbi:MAG: hypothetical protein J7604_26015, partial [Sporocytophaga sp.]|uniref:hypothetical protein n=1 Tax=Sporocytophaga sp. TaxID=2231183 RepID=UPI001B0D5F2F